MCVAFPRNASAQELLTNPGFESGDFSGWTRTGNLEESGVSGGPHTGLYGTSFGQVGSLGYISQVLATNPGSAYDVSWWLASDGSKPSEFQVSAGGADLLDQLNQPASLFTLGIASFIASGETTEVRFGFRNDPGFFHFDDASVRLAATKTQPATATPEFGSVFSLGALLAASGAGFAIRRRRRQASK